MPKYLYEANYTPEGAKGIIKEGGSARKRGDRAGGQGIRRPGGDVLFRVRRRSTRMSSSTFPTT